ncbi:Pumilio domain-containing protein [Smittium culicis]|uniref:Pumilio domain-containing protein n=1 Tax=Smittium culicis TaxID=133412 RepID=A0A1R1YJY7_9FUNG|nr:Pumilio domain-containing protein [Smittium culicis]
MISVKNFSAQSISVPDFSSKRKKNYKNYNECIKDQKTETSKIPINKKALFIGKKDTDSSKVYTKNNLPDLDIGDIKNEPKNNKVEYYDTNSSSNLGFSLHNDFKISEKSDSIISRNCINSPEYKAGTSPFRFGIKPLLNFQTNQILTDNTFYSSNTCVFDYGGLQLPSEDLEYNHYCDLYQDRTDLNFFRSLKGSPGPIKQPSKNVLVSEFEGLTIGNQTYDDKKNCRNSFINALKTNNKNIQNFNIGFSFAKKKKSLSNCEKLILDIFSTDFDTDEDDFSLNNTQKINTTINKNQHDYSVKIKSENLKFPLDFENENLQHNDLIKPTSPSEKFNFSFINKSQDSIKIIADSDGFGPGLEYLNKNPSKVDTSGYNFWTPIHSSDNITPDRPDLELMAKNRTYYQDKYEIHSYLSDSARPSSSSSDGCSSTPTRMGSSNSSFSDEYAFYKYNRESSQYHELEKGVPTQIRNPHNTDENNRQVSTKFNSQKSKFNGMNRKELSENLLDAITDQYGCRSIQKSLEQCDDIYMTFVYNKVKDIFPILMVDPFGNYFCQKFLECCSDDIRTDLVEVICRDIEKISINIHGTRALQKLIEYSFSNSNQVNNITKSLESCLIKLIKDLNGNHVIQKVLQFFSSEDCQFIYDAVSRNCLMIASHRHGCCVFQRCADQANSAQLSFLCSNILENLLSLVKDPYGNYVIQYILDLKDPEFLDMLIPIFSLNFITLSKHKFSSNVIEKCIRVSSYIFKDSQISGGNSEKKYYNHNLEKISPKKRIELLVSNLIKSPSHFETLIKDPYGNYVVQTLIEHAEIPLRSTIVKLISQISNSIRATTHGKRILNKISKHTHKN